jgi:hypothetical protein
MRIKPYNKSKTWLAVRKKLARSAKKGCLPHSGKDLIRLLPQHFAHWGSALGADLRLNSLNSHPLVLLHPIESRIQWQHDRPLNRRPMKLGILNKTGRGRARLYGRLMSGYGQRQTDAPGEARILRPLHPHRTDLTHNQPTKH